MRGNTGLLSSEGLTFLSDGTLIGASSFTGEIRTIDTATGAGTFLANINPARDIDGLTMAPVEVSTIAGTFSAGTIFMADSNRIYAINPTTFTNTLLGTAAAGEGIAFNADGTLFGAGGGVVNEIDLLTLATVASYSTGFSTFAGGLTSATPFAAISAPPPAVVPLPAALPLFGTGLGILGFLGWRRRRKLAESAQPGDDQFPDQSGHGRYAQEIEIAQHQLSALKSDKGANLPKPISLGRPTRECRAALWGRFFIGWNVRFGSIPLKNSS